MWLSCYCESTGSQIVTELVASSNRNMVPHTSGAQCYSSITDLKSRCPQGCPEGSWTTTLSMVPFKWLESVRMLNSVSCRVLYESRWVLTLIFYYMWQDNWQLLWWVTRCIAMYSCSKLYCSFRKCLRHSLEADLFACFRGRDPVFLYRRSDIA